MFLFECNVAYHGRIFAVPASFCPIFVRLYIYIYSVSFVGRPVSQHPNKLPPNPQILTIFTTVGFGDMSAWTTGETLYADWAMYLGAESMELVESGMLMGGDFFLKDDDTSGKNDGERNARLETFGRS